MLKGVIPNLDSEDSAVIDDYKNRFSAKTDKELAEAYFKQQKSLLLESQGMGSAVCG